MAVSKMKPTGAPVLRITNSRPCTIDFHIEPWGDVHAMMPGAEFDVTAVGPEPGLIAVEFGDDRVTIWGWPGSVLHVYSDDVELGRGTAERRAVPPTPARSLDAR